MRFSAFSKERRLEDLSEAVQHCSLCTRLCERSKVLSEANGNIKSNILFVAEAPGRLGADRTGIPLYGDKTGDNFEALLGNVGWKRDQIFITNAVLCNPRKEDGNNSTPTQEEIRNCSCYLSMTINLVQPEVVVSLGISALQALDYISPHSLNLKENVGHPQPWGGRVLFPLYHPGPRALVHRSLLNQRADFMVLAKYVQLDAGIIQKKLKPKRSEKQSSLNNDTVTPFQQVILAIIQSLGKITYFKLTKLLYLIDLLSIEKTGFSITGQLYLRQQEGPWPPSLQETVQLLNGYELKCSYLRKLPMVEPGSLPRFDINLQDEHLNILFDVLEKYGQLSNGNLKTAVYLTAPMRYILNKEKTGTDLRNARIIYKNKTIID
jgi:uracil-DNA glycosylase family 4